MAGQKKVAGYMQHVEWEKNKAKQNNKKHAAKNFLSNRLSFTIEGEIKSFPDKQKLKEFITTKPALQQMVRGTLCQVNK